MRIRTIGLLVLVFASGRVDAVCWRPGPEGTVLLRGQVLDCRSALPELEAALEPGRDSYEERATFYRNSVLSHNKNLTRPYEEHVAARLSRVQGVIVTFLADGRALISVDAKSPAAWEEYAERRELFLRLDGSSCDRLPAPPPTVLAEDYVCCDVMPSGDDSCMLGLRAFEQPEKSLLEKVR